MDTTALIFAALSGEMLGRVADYQSFPAIFNDRAPDNFLASYSVGDKPFIVIAAASDDRPDDTFTEFGRVVTQDVRLYEYASGSTAGLDSLALVIRGLFHAQADALTPLLEGGKVVIATVSGPVASPTTDPALIGRRLTLRLTLEET